MRDLVQETLSYPAPVLGEHGADSLTFVPVASVPGQSLLCFDFSSAHTCLSVTVIFIVFTIELFHILLLS